MTITGPDRTTVPDPAAIPLPPVDEGARFRRRRQQERQRRRRVLVVAGVLAVVVVVVAGIAIVTRDGGAKPADTGTANQLGVPVVKVPPVLLAERDADGRANWLTALVPAPDGEGGSIVLIPAGTMTEVPSLGLDRVGTALAAGGPTRLLFTTENLVGASLGTVEVIDADQLAKLMEPTGPLTVDVPARVEDVFPSGRVEVLYEAGRNRVEPAEVSRLLTAVGRGSDLARLARHQAFWDAWLARLAKDPTLLPDKGALGKAVLALATGHWETSVLPVKSAGTLGEGQEIYQVERDRLQKFVSGIFPGAKAAAAARPRVQILNGTGELELAQRVAQKLVPAGVEVTLTGNANPLGQLQTQVIYYEADKRAMAQKVRDALGVGVLVRNRNRTDVVDVTVIVGKDFPTQ
jgi:hypothetical protein